MNHTSTNYKKEHFDIAYFSAEIGISASLPTYSGGLGVLAGDHLKGAADAGLSICGITLLYKEGYFKQRVSRSGKQTESYPRFEPFPMLEKLPVKFTLRLRERDVWVQVYRHIYKGINGNNISIFFLDTELEENFPDDRIITLRLYSGDKDHRILQEAILGFGGAKLLNIIADDDIKTYHMNEGHCSFLTLELLEKFNGDVDKVREKCHFTTHTPVEAGHDHFAVDRCKKLLHGLIPDDLQLPSLVKSSRWHMTELGLHFSRSANGVSALHGEVARHQFPWSDISHITNGVYHPYWIGKYFRYVFDKYLNGWRGNPNLLLNIDEVPDEKMIYAHQSQKNFLLEYSNSLTQRALPKDVLTIGFARRAASYKRARLIFSDIDRLIEIGQGTLQIIFAGKAHPNDTTGKEIVREIVGYSDKLFGKVKVVYLENYNMWLGRQITSSVDVWLNTPIRPNEASGTSGMKATLNGIPNFSILDGWWAEGCRNGENGWAIGGYENSNDEKDADHLYNILENEIIPKYYNNKEKWISIMRESIKTGVNFTAHRMVKDYNRKFYNVNS